MTFLGPPNRGSDPLHVLTMALALVAAATVGAALGIVIDLASEALQEAPAASPSP